MYQTAQLIKQEEWVSPDAQRCMPANTQDIHLVLERDKNLNIDHCRALKRRQSYCFAALHCKPDELHCAVLDFLLCLAFCICQSSRNEFGLTWICDQQNATVYSAAYFFPINVHMIVLSIDLHSFFFFFFLSLCRRRFPWRRRPSAQTSQALSTSPWSPWTSWITAAPAAAACTRTAAEATATRTQGRAARTAARWTSPPPPASRANPERIPWARSVTRCTTASPPAPARAQMMYRGNELEGGAVVPWMSQVWLWQQVKFLTLTEFFFPFSVLLFSCLDVEGYCRALEWISGLIFHLCWTSKLHKGILVDCWVSEVVT